MTRVPFAGALGNQELQGLTQELGPLKAEELFCAQVDEQDSPILPDDEDPIVALLEAGASGYVTAEQPFTDLVAAVEAAANGELPCPPRLSAALARRIAALAAEKRHELGNGTLTRRQREIATLIADGLSNKQIARRLLIEQATVKNHVHTILVKLGVSRRDQVGRRLGTL